MLILDLDSGLLGSGGCVDIGRKRGHGGSLNAKLPLGQEAFNTKWRDFPFDIGLHLFQSDLGFLAGFGVALDVAVHVEAVVDAPDDVDVPFGAGRGQGGLVNEVTTSRINEKGS